jgi:hypothetical protein
MFFQHFLPAKTGDQCHTEADPGSAQTLRCPHIFLHRHTFVDMFQNLRASGFCPKIDHIQTKFM